MNTDFIKKYAGLINNCLVTVLVLVVFGFLISKSIGRVQKKLTWNFIQSHIKIDPVDVAFKAKNTTLAVFTPLFTNIDVFLQRPLEFDHKELFAYIKYYEYVTKFYPGMSEAHGLLGYCYYYAGRVEDAFLSFQKASYLDPKVFLYQYNLGFIMYQKGNYLQAESFFLKSAKLEIEPTFRMMRSSLLYRQIVESLTDSTDVAENLSVILKRSRIMLLMSFYQNKEFDKVVVMSEEMNRLSPDQKNEINCYSALALLELKKFPLSYVHMKNCVQSELGGYDAYRYLGLIVKVLGRTEEFRKIQEILKTFEGNREGLLSYADKINLAVF